MKYEHYWYNMALQVACPLCGARPDNPCRYPSYRKRRPHAARVSRAVQTIRFAHEASSGE